MNILQCNKRCATVLLPSARHVCTTAPLASETRNPLIKFPEKPPLDQIYAGVQAVKSMTITPKVVLKQQASPPRLNRVTPNLGKTVVETNYVKANGISVVFEDVLPDKYKRYPLSEDEIEYIMRGGRDL